MQHASEEWLLYKVKCSYNFLEAIPKKTQQTLYLASVYTFYFKGYIWQYGIYIYLVGEKKKSK